MTESTSFSLSRTAHPTTQRLMPFRNHCCENVWILKNFWAFFYNPKYLAKIPTSELRYPPLVLFPNFVKSYLNINTFHLKSSNRQSVFIPLPSHTCFFSLHSYKHWLDLSNIIWGGRYKIQGTIIPTFFFFFRTAEKCFSNSFLNTITSYDKKMKEKKLVGKKWWWWWWWWW
jgi:hypothetical protein